MFRFTQHIFEGAILVNVIILKLKLIHVMILNRKRATRILDWDHQHTVLNDARFVNIFIIGEVLLKYAIVLSLFLKECKNFILKPILRVEILLCKLIQIFSGYENFPLPMAFSKFHSHIGYKDKKLSFADC